MGEPDDNMVYVGRKSVGNYIGAVLTQFGQFDEVHVVARGKEYIGKAVDTAEIVRNSHDKKISNVETGTDERMDEDEGRMYRVSTIHITLEN